MTALAGMSVGTVVSSCSMVNQAISSVRSIDMSQYPGLDIVANAQKEMIEQYSQSTKLLLQSRLAAEEALILDAEAIAANEKTGDIYSFAKKIAANGKDKQKLLQAQKVAIRNGQDAMMSSQPGAIRQLYEERKPDIYTTLIELARDVQNTQKDKKATHSMDVKVSAVIDEDVVKDTLMSKSATKKTVNLSTRW